MTCYRIKQGVLCMADSDFRQCSYCSYNGSFEAWKKKIQTHAHRDRDGVFIAAAYGPAELCTRSAAQEGK